MNSVGPVGLPPHAEKTLEPLEHTVLTQTDPAGQFAAVGTLCHLTVTLLAQLARMLQGACWPRCLYYISELVDAYDSDTS